MDRPTPREILELDQIVTELYDTSHRIRQIFLDTLPASVKVVVTGLNSAADDLFEYVLSQLREEVALHARSLPRARSTRRAPGKAVAQ